MYYLLQIPACDSLAARSGCEGSAAEYLVFLSRVCTSSGKGEALVYTNGFPPRVIFDSPVTAKPALVILPIFARRAV